MRIELEPNRFEEISADALIVPVFKGEGVDEALLQNLNKLSNGAIASLFEAGEIKGKKLELTYVHLGKQSKVARLILVGAGEREKYTPFVLGQLAGAATRLMRSKRLARTAMLVRDLDNKIESTLAARTIAENAILAAHEQALGNGERLTLAGDRDQRQVRICAERGVEVA